MLYIPWRNEETDIKGNHPSFAPHCHARQIEIQINESKYTINAEAIEEALQDLHENGPPEHAWADIAPGAEHNRLLEEHEGEEVERNLEQEDLDANAEMIAGTPPRRQMTYYTGEANKQLLSHKEYCQMMQSLNTKQRELIMYHRKWCKEAVIAIKNGQLPKPYHVFLSGPGGVGKSHIINLVYNDTVKLLRLAGHMEPDDVSVLLAA